MKRLRPIAKRGGGTLQTHAEQLPPTTQRTPDAHGDTVPDLTSNRMKRESVRRPNLLFMRRVEADGTSRYKTRGPVKHKSRLGLALTGQSGVRRKEVGIELLVQTRSAPQADGQEVGRLMGALDR